MQSATPVGKADAAEVADIKGIAPPEDPLLGESRGSSLGRLSTWGTRAAKRLVRRERAIIRQDSPG